MTETPPHCLCLVWRTLAVQLLCLQSSEEEAGSTAGRYMMARPWEAAGMGSEPQCPSAKWEQCLLHRTVGFWVK